MSERLRWRIARWLDRRDGWCWANLVGWALYGSRSRPLRECRIDATCRRDAARTGTCYCGALLGEGTAPDEEKREWRDERDFRASAAVPPVETGDMKDE